MRLLARILDSLPADLFMRVVPRRVRLWVYRHVA